MAIRNEYKFKYMFKYMFKLHFKYKFSRLLKLTHKRQVLISPYFCIKRGEIPTRVLLKNILLLSTQMRIIAVHQSLVPASPCPQWMLPSRVVFIVVVLVIKIYALFSDVHPFYHLTRGSKSQKIKWARIW